MSKYKLKPRDHILEFFTSLPTKNFNKEDLVFIDEFLQNPAEPKINDKNLKDKLPVGAENFANDLAKLGAWKAIAPLFKAQIFSASDLLARTAGKDRLERHALLLSLGLDENSASMVSFYVFIGK